jgi:hypothetical protein
MRKILKFKNLVLIVLIPFFLFIGIYLGMKLSTDYDVNSFKQFICNIDTYASRYIAKPTTAPNSIEILIAEEEYQQLNTYRNNAVIKGVVLKEHKNYIKGNIIYNKQIYDTEIRLKGDYHFLKLNDNLRVV